MNMLEEREKKQLCSAMKQKNVNFAKNKKTKK
jgi:hypothetical protein